MMTDFKKKVELNQIVKRESKISMMISLGIIGSIIIYGLIAYFIRIRIPIDRIRTIQSMWEIFSVIAVLLVIIVLAVRKTIYFSPRLIRDDFSLVTLLQRWRAIDIVLLSFGETISLLGLILAFSGMPFKRTYFFFISSLMVVLILMPIPWKVRDKLRNFEKYAGPLNE